MTDLEQVEQLVRDTLSGRAATVDSGPGLPASPDRIRHPATRRWLPVAATAAAVIAAASGLAVWKSTGSGGNRDAAGSGRVVCHTTLPAGWSAARSASPLQVDGATATAGAVAPNGELLLDGESGDHSRHLVLRAPSGGTTPVAQVSAKLGLTIGGTDGTSVVYTTNPDPSAVNGSDPEYDIVLVDVRSGAVSHLLTRAPIPAGWVVAVEATLQNGVVYWSVKPPADDSRGIVLSYSVARRTYHVLARPDHYPYVFGDVRGVAWPGGSARLAGVPSDLPPILDPSGDLVSRLASNGETYGWQLVDGDQSVFYWANGAGMIRVFRFEPDAGRDPGGLSAVAGPFVFLHFNQPGHSEFVLDTRTGAVAPTDGQAYSSLPGGNLFAEVNGQQYQVDPAKLPELHC